MKVNQLGVALVAMAAFAAAAHPALAQRQSYAAQATQNSYSSPNTTSGRLPFSNSGGNSGTFGGNGSSGSPFGNGGYGNGSNSGSPFGNGMNSPFGQNSM